MPTDSTPRESFWRQMHRYKIEIFMIENGRIILTILRIFRIILAIDMLCGAALLAIIQIEDMIYYNPKKKAKSIKKTI